jgi:hypothetical protein
MDNNTCIAIILGMTLFIGTILGCTLMYHVKQVNMAKQGFCEVQMMGQSSTIWQKCDK